MNSNRQLLKRLLSLYPIKSVKSDFEQTGNASDVLELVSGHATPAQIRTFSRANFYSTKQHVYIKELNSQFRRNFDPAELPFSLIDSSIEDHYDTFFLFAKVKYDVVLGGDDLTTDELHFYQPILIRARASTLVYHITILEKNISHYYIDRPLIKAEKQTEESQIVNRLDSFFDAIFGVNSLDLNAGVKHLWEHDWIDSKHVKFRKDRSTATELMDEDFTVKDQYPEYYQQIIQAPLHKTVFKYLRDDQFFPDHFTIDPGSGIINIPLFPKTPQQINNVIAEILRNN